MNKINLILSLIIPFLLFAFLANGQENEGAEIKKLSVNDSIVYGTVIDEISGEPIYFVIVSINKKQKANSTDFDGKFSINASTNDTLVFSCVGYKTQKVRASIGEMKIKLQQTEPLVEQYGPIEPVKHSDITAITKVTEKEIKQEKKVTGKIFSKENNEIIFGATVKNKKKRKETFSDVDGKFEIEATVNDILKIQFLGMADIEIKVTYESYYEIYLEKYVVKKTRKQMRQAKRELRKKGFIIYED